MSLSPRSRWLSFATLFGAVAGVVVAGGVVVMRHAADRPESDLHARLHQAVPLDANETLVLEEKEQAFQRRRAEIEARLRVANGRLANAIAQTPTWSPDVEKATQEVERAAAELQRATLVHVFEMRAGLKPEHRPAYDRVLIESLRRGSQ